MAMHEILLEGMRIDTYLQKYEIFGKTKHHMMECLENWYGDDPERFQTDMRADFRTVAETYQFREKIAAIGPNYRYKPPLKCLSASVDIFDGQGCYTATYTAFFAFDGNCFDDQLTT